MNAALPITLALLLATTSQISAQESPTEIFLPADGPGSLILHAHAEMGIVRLALFDTLKVTMSLEGAEGMEVKTPEKPVNSKGWRLIAASPQSWKKLEGARVRWQQTLTFEPLTPGDLVLQLDALTYRSGTQDWQKLRWPAVPVQVATTIAVADPGALRDPTIIEHLPKVENSGNGYLWIAIILAALLGIGGVWYWLRRPAPPHALPSEHWAQRELDKLAALRLPEQGKIEGFHTLLANILRRYLENKFSLPARRRTTPEFNQVLESSSLNTEQRRFVGDCLSRCDLAKFAGATISLDDCASLQRQTRDFIVRTSSLG